MRLGVFFMKRDDHRPIPSSNPNFAFPPSAIIKRKPLSVTARRAGWVGCNFALDRIPIDARISVVRDQIISPAGEVRDRFRKVKPLSELPVTERGWTLDVLNIVRRIQRGARAGATPEGARVVFGAPVESPVQKWGAHAPSRAVFGAPAEHIPHSPIEFSNEDIYAFERELETLHPGNRHIRDKIRQQLQILRDRGFLLHLGRNRWQIKRD